MQRMTIKDPIGAESDYLKLLHGMRNSAIKIRESISEIEKEKNLAATAASAQRAKKKAEDEKRKKSSKKHSNSNSNYRFGKRYEKKSQHWYEEDEDDDDSNEEEGEESEEYEEEYTRSHSWRNVYTRASHKSRRSPSPLDHFSVLGLKQTCTIEEVNKAFRTLSLKHHPDKGGVKDAFNDILAAKDCLIDSAARKTHINDLCTYRKKYPTWVFTWKFAK
jgi:DnaJ domain